MGHCYPFYQKFVRLCGLIGHDDLDGGRGAGGQTSMWRTNTIDAGTGSLDSEENVKGLTAVPQDQAGANR